MQAIQTKYLPATNNRGSRVKAWCQAKSITVLWEYELGVEGNHKAAAMAVVRALGWEGYGAWVLGCLPNPGGYVAVCVPKGKR